MDQETLQSYIDRYLEEGSEKALEDGIHEVIKEEFANHFVDQKEETEEHSLEETHKKNIQHLKHQEIIEDENSNRKADIYWDTRRQKYYIEFYKDGVVEKDSLIKRKSTAWHKARKWTNNTR